MNQLTEGKITEWVNQQKAYFETGATRDIGFRIQQLKRLKQAIQKHEGLLLDALYQDLRKSHTEGYASEIGLVLYSISYMMKHVKKWAKPTRVKTPIPLIGTSSYIKTEPYGSVLIIGPFNYPVSLILEPLIGSIAAGNCSIVKPSEYTPNVAKAIKIVIEEAFEPQFVTVVEGAKDETSWLIHAPFDYMFFTGSTKVGKIVMEAAANRLVPVTLELGGKSPVIIDQTAKIEIAAQRVVWGKLLNNGQTCIAPDYMLVHDAVYDHFIVAVKKAIHQFYSDDIMASADYGRIVSDQHFTRLKNMLLQDEKHIMYGGQYDSEERYIAPTLIDGGSVQQPIQLVSMTEEVFGPICAVLKYEHLQDAISFIKRHEKPLALYVFTESKEIEHAVIDQISFGGGCVNDTLSHYINHELPFGGVGPSGLGSYHGKHSFNIFSHTKSILKRSSFMETGLLFPPYKEKLKLLKKVLK